MELKGKTSTPILEGAAVNNLVCQVDSLLYKRVLIQIRGSWHILFNMIAHLKNHFAHFARGFYFRENTDYDLQLSLILEVGLKINKLFYGRILPFIRMCTECKALLACIIGGKGCSCFVSKLSL